MSSFRRGTQESSSSERSRRRAHDWWDTGQKIGRAAEEAKRTLFLRGRDAEDGGDPGVALDLYVRALQIRGGGRLPIQTGAILHHIGSCSSLLGDKPLAWDSYLGAARLFHERRVEGAISASLGEAGLLLVDFRPPVAIREAMTHALLLDGVADAIDDAAGALLGSTPGITAPAIIHRKLTGLMVLATAAAADVILEMGALALYGRVARPLSTRHDELSRGRWDGPISAGAFDALARLYEAVGKQEKPERASVPPTREEVEALTSFAALAFPGEQRPLMLRWLGSFLRDRRGATWVTDDLLAVMARAL